MPTLVGLETHEHQTNQFHDGANGYSIITASPIDGTAHGRLVGAASAAYVLYNSAGDPPAGIVVGSVTCRFTALTLPAAGTIVTAVQCFYASGMGVGIDSNGNWVYQGQSSVSGADAPLAMTLNQLYRIDFILNVTANPWTLTAMVTPVSSPTDATGTPNHLGTGLGSYAANPTGLSVRAGNTTSFTGTFEYTNYIWSFTSADYPLGPCSGRGYVPNAVGTHNLDAATSAYYFSHVASDAALTTSETTSYQNLDELPVGSGSDDIRVIPGSSSTSGQSSTGATTATSVTGTWTSITNAQGAPQNAIGTAAGTTNAASGTPAKSGSLVADLSGWSGITGDTVTALTVKARGAFSAVGGVGTQIRCDVYNGATLAASGTAQTPSVATFQDYTFTFTGLSVPVGNLTIRVSYLRGNTNTAYTAYLDGAALSAVTTSAAVQPSAALYAEYNFTDESTLALAPAAVKVDVVADMNSAVTSTWRAALFDADQGTNTQDVINNTSFATAAKTYLFKFFNQRPNSGGAWTLAALNALRLRFGLTAAASGGPRLAGAIAEAIFFPVASTPKSDSDSNGATTESASVVARPSDTDASGAITESGVPTATPSVSDANTAVVENGTIAQARSGSDANSAVTEAASISVPVSASDSNGAATEATTQISRNTSADTNAATTEAASPVNKTTVTDASGPTTEISPIALGATDSGSSVEASVISAPVAASDANGPTTDTPTLAAKPSVADANSTVTETPALVYAPSSTDAGTDTEAVIETRQISVPDANSTTIEGASAAQPGTPVGSDAGSGTESAAVPLATVGATETGAGAESATASVPVNVTDVASSLDSATMKAAGISAESGAGSDLGNLKLVLVLSDSGTSTEATRLTLTGVDAGAAADISSLRVALSDADVEIGIETTILKQSGAIIGPNAPHSLLSAAADVGVLTSGSGEKAVLTSAGREPDDGQLGKVGV